MSGVRLPKQARTQFALSKLTRNGLVPSAEFQAQLAEATGFGAYHRPKQVFSRACAIAGIPNSTSGTRIRWRFAWDSSKYVDGLVAFMELGPATSDLHTQPYGLIEIGPIESDGSEGDPVGIIRINWGATSGGLTDVPRNFWSSISTLVDPDDGFTPVSLTPLTAYYGRVSDVDGARIIAVSVLEMPMAPDTDNGYPRTGAMPGDPVFDEDRLSVVRMQRNLWNHGGQSLWNYTTEVAAFADSVTPTAEISGSLVQSIGEFTLLAEGTSATTMPTFQASRSLRSATASSLSVSWPTHQSGDIGILLVGTYDSGPSLSTPAGFAFKVSSGLTSADYFTIYAYWCRATSSSMTAPVIAAGTSYTVATMLTFRGCTASGDPVNVSNGRVGSGVSSTTIDTLGCTTTVDNCIVLTAAIMGGYTDGFEVNHPNTATWSETERFDESASFAGIGYGNHRGITAATTGKATAGAVSSFTGTLAQASISHALILALKP